MHKHINQKTISQFELEKYGESLLSLMRLHRENNYSVLNNVYVSSPSLLPRNSDRKIKGLIAEYLVKETNKPLYVACNKKWAKFYQQSGFVPVKMQRIPQKFRLGARINSIVGGVNLVLE